MKIEISIAPWFLPMTVETPNNIKFDIASSFELSLYDINRYISLVKAEFSNIEELAAEFKNAPATIQEDADDFWASLYKNQMISSINVVWNEEAKEYINQIVLDDLYASDTLDDDEDIEDAK